jgi:hypothetical protein
MIFMNGGFLFGLERGWKCAHDNKMSDGGRGRASLGAQS